MHTIITLFTTLLRMSTSSLAGIFVTFILFVSIKLENNLHLTILLTAGFFTGSVIAYYSHYATIWAKGHVSTLGKRINAFVTTFLLGALFIWIGLGFLGYYENLPLLDPDNFFTQSREPDLGKVLSATGCAIALIGLWRTFFKKYSLKKTTP